MSDVFQAFRGVLTRRAAWADINIEPYIARIEDGAQQSRGVGISVSDDTPLGERRFRGGSSNLRRADISVAVMTRTYAETEALVQDLSAIETSWTRPQRWMSAALTGPAQVGDPMPVAILATSYRIATITRLETAERYYRGAVSIEITYRRL